jgi:hypothetical protein
MKLGIRMRKGQLVRLMRLSNHPTRGVRGVIAAVGVVSLLGLFLVGGAGPAGANTYTAIQPPGGGELSHSEILDLVYGSGFVTTGVSGLDFTNGTVTASRVWDTDDGDETLHVYLGDESGIDRIWTDGTVQVSAQVKYAEHDQSFGWNQGGLGTSYQELLTEVNLGGPAIEIEVTGDFLWGSQPQNGGAPEEWWSELTYNNDGQDHLVTYFIEGLPDLDGVTVWLQFWEDLPSLGDADFNDFVVEVQAVPEPGTLVLAGLALAGFAAHRQRRR